MVAHARTGRANVVDAAVVQSVTAAGYRAEVRLEPLSVFRWSYDEDGRVGADGYTVVSPYGSEEGIAYGEGRGTATGRIEGTAERPGVHRRGRDPCDGAGYGDQRLRRHSRDVSAARLNSLDPPVAGSAPMLKRLA